MSRRGRVRSILLGVIGLPLALLLSYFGAAAWSLHRAELRATEACRLAIPGIPVERYVADLVLAGFTPDSTRDRAGRVETVVIVARSMAMSRFVCEARIMADRVQEAELRYVD